MNIKIIKKMEKLGKILMNNNLIFTVIKNSFSVNDNILIILSKNNNDEKHRFQYLLSFKDSLKLNNYLELINKKGIKNIIEELNIKIQKKNNEILNDKKELQCL